MNESLEVALRIVAMIAALGALFYVYTRWLKKRLEKILPPSDVAKPPENATEHRGVFTRVLIEGDGEDHPEHDDIVTVHYTGWTTDGEMFDSSVIRGIPATFPLEAVIEGWRRGLQLMVVGEKRRFWIPAMLAYGETPTTAGPSGMLVFDVELFAIGDDAIHGKWKK
jgi:FKBP-type peptidyl-prolyl cis-trans isomerase